jgi:hypothetical protein
MNKAWCTAVALACLVSVFGCGGDEGTTPTPVATAGFGGGFAGFGGSTSAVAGTAAPAAIPCGTTTCSAPAIPGGIMIPGLMFRAPCCANQATGTCGTLNAAVCEPPPPPAPACPAPPSLGGFMLKSCCVQATQICGIDGSMVGMGCTTLPAMFGGGGPQYKCDGTPVAPPPAAGAPAVAGAPATTGGIGGVAGTGGVGTVGGAGGATATSGAGGSTTTGGAGGATAGAGGARAGTGGATAGAGGRAF